MALRVTLKRLWAASLAWLLAGCASGPSRWWEDVAPAPPELEKEWEKYHWYVVDVKYSFDTRATLEGTYRGPLSYADLRLVVKALTPEGSQIGTLSIPNWNRTLHSMEVVLLDSSGRRLPVDQARVEEGYRRRGMVVLPRVTKGSTVAVHIRQGPFSVLDYWEYPMAGPAPIYRSTFEFAYPMRLRYHFKGYNGLGPPVHSERRQAKVLTWKAERILPLSEVPFLDAMSARPRLVITSRNDAVGQGFPDWKAVAEHKERQWFGRTLWNRTAETRKVARGLAGGGAAPGAKPSEVDQARVLLAWVQDHISLDPAAPDEQDPDQVLAAQSGNLWQVAALLDEMYAAVGLDADIVLTRDREQGGMDPSVVNPNAAWEPLVIVQAGGREWAACPHARAYGLGDYPPGLFGLAALSVEGRTVRLLPEPAHPQASLLEKQVIRLEPVQERRLSLEMQGPLASLARSYYFAGKWTDTLEYCRAFLRAIGFSGGFRRCSEENMEARDLPLRMELVADNPWTSVERSGARQWSLPDLFSRPAWFYDSARVDDYLFPYEQHRRQVAVFETAEGRKLELDLPCNEADTSALRIDCERGEKDGRAVFTRDVIFRKGRFRAPALRQQHAALEGLDRVRESRVTARQDTARAP